MAEQWHALAPDEALSALGTQRGGLSSSEAPSRLRSYGPNELTGKRKPPAILVFLRQFLSPLIYVLLAAAAVSIAVGHFLDAWVIFGVLIANATLGYVQESRAEKAMQALLLMAAPRATVRRDGTVKEVSARELAPGDVILLETGDKVPADARLLESSNLKVNEASLTGESMPVDKHTGKLGADTALADRKNMVFMGTTVTFGRAAAVVAATGMHTEIGRIAGAIGDIRPEVTPLQKSISRLSRYILFFVAVVLAILVLVGLFRGLGILDLFLLAVAAAVSAIPEGLPAVVTVVLATGMQIMARRHVLIRKLAAVETLGSATVICSDKTGTLTVNQMTARRIFVGGNTIDITGEGYNSEGSFQNGDSYDISKDDLAMLHLRIGALCNDALLSREDGAYSIQGDPTEGALVVAAAKAGMAKERLEREYPRLDEIPFQSERMYMATLHPGPRGERLVYVKGAVEKMLPLCSHLAGADEIRPMGQRESQEITRANMAMAAGAMRVIATAWAELPAGTDELDEAHLKGKLIFVGLTGMADPPREEARLALRHCRDAGVRVVMITGDNEVTAQSVSAQLELPQGKIVTGAQLKNMGEQELADQIELISVFARIEPIDKLKIVNAFKKRGHVVAVTGDGVNDAPALRSANIGIAMGINGTDVAKEASDMVLADDNFASVVAAIEEGRAVFSRLRNVVFFLLSTTMGELLALILCVGLLGVAPLLPLQIIWVNLVTDTAVGIPLGMEPKSGDELRQPPRHPRVGLLFPGLLLRILFMCSLMGFGIFLVFDWTRSTMGLEEARTIAFCTMVMFEWFRSFNARSDERTVFSLGILSNKWLLGSLSLALVLQMTVLYVPFMQTAFGTVPIGLQGWGLAVLAGGSLFVIEELRKLFLPRLFSLGKWRPVGQKRGEDLPAI